MRLVSLTCSNTEWLWALGATQQLVAVDSNSDFPESIQHLPRLGPDLQINLDHLEALRPDLVLSSLSVPGMERVVEGLEQRGIPHLLLDPETLEQVFADLDRVANAIGATQQARSVKGAMRWMMAQAKAQMPRFVRPPKVLIEWWPKPVIAAAQRSWLTQMLQFLGAQNALEDWDARSAALSPQQLEQINPDVVVVSWCGVRKLRPEVVYQRGLNITATQHQAVFAIEEAFLGRPGPRLAQGVQRLAQVLQQPAVRIARLESL